MLRSVSYFSLFSVLKELIPVSTFLRSISSDHCVFGSSAWLHVAVLLSFLYSIPSCTTMVSTVAAAGSILTQLLVSRCMYSVGFTLRCGIAGLRGCVVESTSFQSSCRLHSPHQYMVGSTSSPNHRGLVVVV